MIDGTNGWVPADDYTVTTHSCYACRGVVVDPETDGHVCGDCVRYWSHPITLAAVQSHLAGDREYQMATIVVTLEGGQVIRTRFAEIEGDWVSFTFDGAEHYTRRDRIVSAYVARPHK